LNVAYTAELFNACHVLFGNEIDASLDFLRYLRPSGLKSAYRQKALETHPDRANISGEPEAKLNENFRQVNMAYERLRSVIGKDGLIEGCIAQAPSFHRKTPTNTHENRNRPARESEHYYFGAIPARKLFLGQFLYYSGIISWQTLIKSIAYQRRIRPMIGQIAQGWGMLSENDVRQILRERPYNEKFGEFALRKNYISSFDLMALLGKQQMFQSPLGNYFIKKGILHPDEIETIVKKQKFHNLKNPRSK